MNVLATLRPMSERLQAIERQLRDERSLRLQAEDRVAQLTEQSRLWRARAEERRERVQAMLEERDAHWLTRTVRALRRGTTRPAPGTAATPDEHPPDRRRPHGSSPPTYPQITALAVGSPSPLAPVLRQFRTRSELDARGLADADLVVVDSEALGTLPGADRQLLDEWVGQPARAPLVVWDASDTGQRDGITGHANLTITPRSFITFDPDEHNPRVAGGQGPVHDTGNTALDQLVSLLSPTSGRPATGLSTAHLQQAATGLDEEGDRSRQATRARRLAFRHHAPWVRAHELLQRLGLDAPGPVPRVAAIIMSNRPEQVTSCVQGIARSRHVDLELVIGLHGISVPDPLRRLLDGLERPFRLIEVPASVSLGEGLNRCIDVTGAPVLAKVDDDDHYGPAHLEDALQALRYSRADLVGKGAQFTYLAERDETVLRRPGVEETFLDGTPTGASWVFRRSLWETVPFPHRPRRVDALMLEGARAVDASVYATSRWEFCYRRSRSGHTWDASDDLLLAGAEPCWSGFHPDRVEVTDDDTRP